MFSSIAPGLAGACVRVLEGTVGVRESVAAEQFTIVTSKTPEQIRAAGLRAIEAGKRFMTSTPKEGAVTDDGIQYIVSGPGGLIQQMLINVGWTEVENGLRVTLEAPSYLTTRQSILFIPVTPKRAPALGSLKRFASSLKAELSS
jgi:hypothetical protein